MPRFLLTLLATSTLCAAGPASLADIAARAGAGEPLSVVFFGGSLTFGANASDPETTSYRGRMMRWLRETYPRSPMTFHDAAIGGSGSQLGMFRLERDVLARKPDLVFLDFTVNDGAEDADPQGMASYERILRDLLEREVAVMPVLMPFRWHVERNGLPVPPRHAAHLRLAEAYGLPVADVLGSIREKVAGGTPPEMIWNMGDGAHPGDEGYALFFGAVKTAFETGTREARPARVPQQTVSKDLYPERRRLPLRDHLPEGWAVAKTWRTALWYDGMASRWMDDVAVAANNGTARALEVDFEGTMVGFFGERNGLTPPIRVWIDGAPVKPKTGRDDTLWRLDTTRFAPPKKGSGNLFIWQVLAKDLPEGRHRLRIEPVWEGADKDAELRIESICSAGR